MSLLAQHTALATSMLAELRAAIAPRPITRREDLVRWLTGFLTRSEGKGYHVTSEEVENLSALETHLKAYRQAA